MADKGFEKAKEVEEISAERMKELARADSVSAVDAAKVKRESKAYADEFTDEEDEAEVPEELDSPDVPEKKEVSVKPKEAEVRAGEETAKAIYSNGYQAGYIEGHKKARAEFLVRLVC